MKYDVSNFISRVQFLRSFKLVRKKHYTEFLHHINKQLFNILDNETLIQELKVLNAIRGQQCNARARLIGTVTRNHEEANVQGEIVWVVKHNFFRGNLYLDREFTPDIEVYSECRKLFYKKKYIPFLELSKSLDPNYRNLRIFQKMQEIAKSRI